MEAEAWTEVSTVTELREAQQHLETRGRGWVAAMRAAESEEVEEPVATTAAPTVEATLSTEQWAAVVQKGNVLMVDAMVVVLPRRCHQRMRQSPRRSRQMLPPYPPRRHP